MMELDSSDGTITGQIVKFRWSEKNNFWSLSVGAFIITRLMAAFVPDQSNLLHLNRKTEENATIEIEKISPWLTVVNWKPVQLLS